MGISDTRSALLFALAGFALLSVGDGIIKSLAGEWPGTAVAALRYGFGAIGLAIALALFEGRRGFRVPLPLYQFGRGAAVAFATVSFFIGLFLMPMAEATAITFMSPIITALFSALFLNEAAPRRVWVATLFAFAGVLVVLRPNVEVIGVTAFMPLIATFGMTALILCNRKVAGAGSALQMQFLLAVFAAPLLIGAALAGHFSGIESLNVGKPDLSVVMRIAIVACTATISHLLIYLATVRASAAVVAPMSYVQLLVAGTIGMIAFGDRHDVWAVFGAAMIVGSGIYLWRSEQKRSS
jgi:drug/metabolite transporter (DMT)-like permease